MHSMVVHNKPTAALIHSSPHRTHIPLVPPYIPLVLSFKPREHCRIHFQLYIYIFTIFINSTYNHLHSVHLHVYIYPLLIGVVLLLCVLSFAMTCYIDVSCLFLIQMSICRSFERNEISSCCIPLLCRVGTTINLNFKATLFKSNIMRKCHVLILL